MTAKIEFDTTYETLPSRFFMPVRPSQVRAPELIRVNDELAASLGLDAGFLKTAEGAEILSGNTVVEGSSPIALAYAGHQFGHWNPQLGDGRAVLLGELVDKAGQRYDWQLKGSGRTPFSRGGDGRAPLGPVLREYIVSEAMAAFGVPTTRALAAVLTGEEVRRDAVLPGAVLSRIAKSHIRIGTFEYFAGRGDVEALSTLTDYALKRHFPDAEPAASPALTLLREVAAGQARLIAKWQQLGFIHGVMNTDNMLVSGETIDYGPCAFMDSYDSEALYSSIDRYGRYAYNNQPSIGEWNLACLGRALVPILGEGERGGVEDAQAIIDSFVDDLTGYLHQGMAAKLGLKNLRDDDEDLIEDFLEIMAATHADFTLAFRRLTDLADPESDGGRVGELFEFVEQFDPWLNRWRQRLRAEDSTPGERQAFMRRLNPAFIPRNHLIEAAIVGGRKGDFSLFNRMVDRLAAPFVYTDADADLAVPPKPEEVVIATFCGT